MTFNPGLGTLSSNVLADLVGQVRLFMRDFPALNRLTKGVDHNDRHIMWAILDTVSDWKSTPPPVGQDLEMIIANGWQYIFIRGVVISLLESLRFLHVRNTLPSSDGGVNVQIENPQLLTSVIGMMKPEYEQKKKQALIAANINGALRGGGVRSEYSLVNSFWGLR